MFLTLFGVSPWGQQSWWVYILDPSFVRKLSKKFPKVDPKSSDFVRKVFLWPQLMFDIPSSCWPKPLVSLSKWLNPHKNHIKLKETLDVVEIEPQVTWLHPSQSLLKWPKHVWPPIKTEKTSKKRRKRSTWLLRGQFLEQKGSLTLSLGEHAYARALFIYYEVVYKGRRRRSRERESSAVTVRARAWVTCLLEH